MKKMKIINKMLFVILCGALIAGCKDSVKEIDFCKKNLPVAKRGEIESTYDELICKSHNGIIHNNKVVIDDWDTGESCSLYVFMLGENQSGIGAYKFEFKLTSSNNQTESIVFAESNLAYIDISINF